VLLEHAARGRDIAFAEPRVRSRAAPAEPQADAQAGSPAEAQAAPNPATRLSRPPSWNDNPELYMPTLEELEAQVRCRPIGRTIVDICLDLGVVPGFCTGAFWNELFDDIRTYGGNLPTLMLERVRREKAFSAEQDRQPGSDWSWEQITRDGLRRVLGFFVGEAPVDPFGLAPGPDLATAAGRPDRPDTSAGEQ
jgi:hypothetical protein